MPGVGVGIIVLAINLYGGRAFCRQNRSIPNQN